MAEPLTFAGLLRTLRAEARLTQEELAEASGVRPRTVSDLERGVAVTPQRETIRRLADALQLTGPTRAQFEAAARGRAVPVTAGRPAAATRTLPRDVTSFTGRDQELRELVGVAVGAGSSGGVVSIHAIGGMAGVGKTAFAVHAAHRFADRFPAGQIFLPLHGHTPGQAPVGPADALASLLVTLGVPAGQIPAGLEARMALWRDRLAEKRLLLILDDAASSEQVLPLLPGTGGSLVLVTSRRHLSALDDATAVSLDTLSPGEAGTLLVLLAGRAGLSPGDPAVGEIIRLCGFLPLAIGMVARQLHHHPAWTAEGRAAELAAAVNRLELMQTENLSVAAAFNLSYADLTEDQQRLFRRLGLHPGPDVDAYAAAALDGTDLSPARRALEALYDQYLIAEPARGRYRMHDLIREHARALAGRLDPDDDRDRATLRLLDYYQYTAAIADALVAVQSRPAAASTLVVSTVPTDLPPIADHERALAWLRAERVNLLACLDYATGTGQHARVMALTAGIAVLLRRDGASADAIACHTAAVEAARHLSDRMGEANALNDLGEVWQLTDDYPAAIRDLEEALGITRDLGSQLGQANVLSNLGMARLMSGDWPGAARDLEEAARVYRGLGDRRGRANALLYLGTGLRVTGDYPDAGRVLEEALSIFRVLGNRSGQANTLCNLGDMRQLTGDYPGAARDLEEALSIFRDLDSRGGQANTLCNLGDVRRLTGDYSGAARDLEEALSLQRDIGDRLGEANSLRSLGMVRRATGDYPSALRDLEEALGIYRDIGNRLGEAEVLNEAGTLNRNGGNLGQANSCHQQALDLARQVSSALDEARALAGLGRTATAAGHTAQAEVLLRQAVEIFQRIGAAETPAVLAELNALTSPGPGQ